jgi:hypothetical protein
LVSIDWGRYERLSVILNTSGISVEESGSPDIWQIVSDINQKHAIGYRDELISLMLSRLGCTTLVDFGSDFGSLLHHAKLRNIEAIGVEPNADARALSSSVNLSSLEGRVQDFLDVGSPTETFVSAILKSATGKSAISFLNVAHRSRNDTEAWSLTLRCLEAADYFFFTATRSQVKKLRSHGVCVVPLLQGERFATLNQLHLAMYSRTFVLYGLPTWLRAIEVAFWRFIKGKRRVPDKIATYPRMVVLASTRQEIPSF